MQALDITRQRGQAIVLVALMMVVMFGVLGLALDGGRAYLDRRDLQAAVDAAALAAAYNYMNTNDYSQAEQAATNQYASNQRLYSSPTCTGYGTLNATCAFGDVTSQVLTLTVVSRSIAGTTFTATASHQIGVTVMQVLGSGVVTIGATATALARKPGTNGAAIQTLSPGNCNGGTNSLTFTGSSTTYVSGDIWSNGSVFDNSNQAGGAVNGNVVGVCPTTPFLGTPAPWMVTGVQTNGWNMPDPGYGMPTLPANNPTWNSANGSVEVPGLYTGDPKVTSSTSLCYFLSGGVYDFSAGFTQNAGFVSNELRPPDEASLQANGQPNLTTTASSLTGNISSIPVSSLPTAIAGSTSQHSSYVSVGGQTFVVASSGAAASSTATSIPLKNPAQSVSGSIPSGSWLSVRAYNQFWDSNESSPDANGCSAAFAPTTTGSDSNNPPVGAQTWGVELTAVRWSSNPPGTTCSAQSPSCYLRESAPSMCKTVSVGNNQVIKIAVTSLSGKTSAPDPGAQDFNVYLSPSGSCQGPFGYATEFSNSGNFGTTINGSTLAGWSLNANGTLDSAGAPPPDGEQPPTAAGLPNSNPPAGTPPHGDLANEGHCVDPTTGNNIACPSSWTPGAVEIFIPGGGNNSTCLNLQGGGDFYVFTGYQYGRILLYEPGPEQQPPPNTCSNNVAGAGITSLIGIFYVPAASVTIVGSSSYLATIAGGVIAWTASIKGNGGVSITADPTLRAWPSTVRLTQ